MADVTNTAVQWLRDQLKDHASQTVSYKRGATTISNIKATIGRTWITADDGLGNKITERTDRDFIFDASYISSLGDPRRGDQIIEVVDGVTYTYTLLAPGVAEVWRYTDDHRKMIRVHTKQVSVV